MLSQGRPERAAADHNEVERPEVPASGEASGTAGSRVDRNECFVEGVANVAPEYVARKVSVRGR